MLDLLFIWHHFSLGEGARRVDDHLLLFAQFKSHGSVSQFFRLIFMVRPISGGVGSRP